MTGSDATTMLNNIDHQHYRVLHQFSAALGDNLPTVPVVPTEFDDLQKEYPILLRKDVAAQWQPVALLGFAAGENLYLSEKAAHGWDAHYIPASVEKGPFRIGFQRPLNLTDEPAAVIHLDPAHVKVQADASQPHFAKAQPLFLAQGGNSPYLEYIAGRLDCLHRGAALQSAFCEALAALDLIVPVNIELTLVNSEKIRLTGNYCLYAGRLAALGGDALQQLHQQGFLAPAFAMVSSMSHIDRLLARKNALLRAHAA